MIKKLYYYTLEDLLGIYYRPFLKMDFENDFLISILDLTEEEINATLLPDYSETLANELLSFICGKYHNKAGIKIVKGICEEEPDSLEKEKAWHEWAYRYITLFNDTYDFYATLLTQYANAKAQLMEDIVATSKNKVKFNDTPQNNNESGGYEGDNYITHFTSTEGEQKSPLMSKMMRLKEIQDNYRDLMSEWVNDFHKIFYEEDC